MNYLLDTNVISELVSKQPDSNVVQWVDSTDERSLHLSVITLGEIQRGIEKLPESRRRTDLQTWLQTALLARFAGRILPLDVETMLRWGTVVAALERKGRPLPAMDSLIAATAVQYNLTIVTRNTKDFADTDIQTVNPWQTQNGPS